jgi:capsular exopolysaccharide synthesis family protein
LDKNNPGLDGWLLPTQVENLRLLPPGSLPLNPSELLGSERMGQIIEALTQEADVVIFDTPPVLAVTDAAVLSQKVGGVLLVLEAGGTQEQAGRRMLAELAQVDAPILGVVLNKIPTRGPESYGYYRYRYSYGNDQQQSASRLGRLWRKFRHRLSARRAEGERELRAEG